jgi:hypothetical protein
VKTRHKIELAIVGLIVVAVLIVVGVIVRRRLTQRLIMLQGAITVQDHDVRKERPISGVEVTVIDKTGSESTKTDSNGYFSLNVHQGIRRGYPIKMEFRHPDYHPLDLGEYVGDQLYVVHMLPRVNASPNDDRPAKKVSNVTVRYSVKTVREVNIGSRVETFQVQNLGNVPCKNQHPCSPDGKWKAALGSTSLDAGTGNEFQDARVSCIAGPCPFTRIESDRSSRVGQVISVTARDWSDTATFLLEAEVLHPMPTEIAHEFYPVIFGRELSFTLPAAVEGVTIEADIDKQRIFFPLGPALLLSWANCSADVNPDQTKVYRCGLKPGYQFE